MGYRIRTAKPNSHQNGFWKQATILVLLVFAALLFLSFPVIFEGMMMWLSAVGEHQRAWDKRCSENALRLERIESLIEQGDWKFAIGLEELPKEMRVRLLASESFLKKLFDDKSGVKAQLEELSEYRYCRKANKKINIQSFESEFDFLVAVYDGSVLHDCTEVYLWQQIADGLIKQGYWASVKSVPYKDGFEPILELKVNPKFTHKPRTGERVDWVKYSKYESLVTRIGACTGYRSDFLHDDGRFRSGRGNVDSDLEWVRINPTPGW